MKGFKKLALVAAIAAPFSSVHALEAIDDSMLSDMTGQSGVTIDLQTQVDIDSVTWTDTDNDADGIGGGSVVISDIAIGGIGGGALDDIRITIDSGEEVALAATGGTSEAGKDALVVNISSQSGLPVDLGLSVGSIGLGGNTSALMSNLSMDVQIGPQAIVIHEDADGNGHIDMAGYFRVDSLDVDVNLLGAGVRNMAVGQIDFAATGELTATTSYVWAEGDLLAAKQPALDAKRAELTAQKTALEDKQANTPADFTAEDAAALAAVNAGLAGVAAVEASARGFASYGLDVTTNDSNQLVANVNNFKADIAIGDVTLGGGSIGSVAIDDLSITNTSLTVYGH